MTLCARQQGGIRLDFTNRIRDQVHRTALVGTLLAKRRLYLRARRLLITADGGGGNGWRLRLWKWELQRLADQTGLTLTVCHFPPGTSKWNRE